MSALDSQMEGAPGVQYWRGLQAQGLLPENVPHTALEFPKDADRMDPDFSRRDFMKLMGASFGLAGLAGLGVACRRPVEMVVPFGQQPEGYTHGVAQYFASARPTRTGAVPLLVESNEGRPTKVEGNPDFPGGNGSTDLHTQAAILNLYDPDRASVFRGEKGETLSRSEALQKLRTDVVPTARNNNGAHVAFLLEPGTSPTRLRLLARVKETLPAAKFYQWDPLGLDVSARASEAAFGKPVRPHYHLDRADVILSLDCDFIGGEEDSHRHIRDFARGRKLNTTTARNMSRLYVVEPLMTLTGASADHRLRLRAGDVAGVAAALAGRLGLPGFDDKHLPSSVKASWLDQCAGDLRGASGRVAVLAGHRQPAAVHQLAQALNEALGAIGVEADHKRPVEMLPGVHPADDWKAPVHGGLDELVSELNAGRVRELVILGGNPAYTAPADLNWAQAQARAKTVVRLGDHADESSRGCTLHLGKAHFLESWGDARTTDGTLVPVQPLIQPLFGGLSELEVLAEFAGVNRAGAHELVRETFRELTGAENFEDRWKQFLHQGFWPGSESPVEAVKGAKTSPLAPAGEGLEVIFTRDHSVEDGRYANNGWLQELPDPITKITWDNAILVSRKTAEAQGWQNGLRLALTVGPRSVEGPVWIQPGQADGTLALALGYGRDPKAFGGRIACFGGKAVGFNAYAIRTAGRLHFDSGAKAALARGTHKFSCTQDHWSMEGRAIVREANLEGESGYAKKPDFARQMDLDAPEHARHTIDPKTGKPYQIYEHPYNERPKLKNAAVQWGMSIDLNSCVGCNACVVACQSENNIPIVGKEQVGKGREMHWLRIDRYYTGFAGDPHHRDTGTDAGQSALHWIDDPQVVQQPMLCQHCESAPCESVCPVNATVHDDEGLNVMVYNRCIGTRYCSNNCAWKVRRFNFFDYNKRPITALYQGFLASVEKDDPGAWDVLKLAKNPDVTVRMRGVMEKCTYCVQRIEQAKIARKLAASREYRDAVARDGKGHAVDAVVPDGTVRTACQQACPAEAISFGNMADPESLVSQLKRLPRNYAVLGFLDTKPHTTYLARVRNPNLKVPGPYDGYYTKPLSSQDYDSKAAHPDAHGTQGDHGAAPGSHKEGGQP